MLTCPYCDEPISGEDSLAPFMSPPTHYECALRAVVGGINHQMGNCTCQGGDLPPDPPGVSARKAAQIAADHFRRNLH
jgi:hypothetical protein